jgi:putative FmdB family regulatory protein
MPLYEYRCSSCGELTEALQHIGDAPLSECPHCGGTLERITSAPALHFKGSGWYVTDYGRGGENGSKAKTADAKAEKAESAAKDKPESKAAEKPASTDGAAKPK